MSSIPKEYAASLISCFSFAQSSALLWPSSAVSSTFVISDPSLDVLCMLPLLCYLVAYLMRNSFDSFPRQQITVIVQFIVTMSLYLNIFDLMNLHQAPQFLP
ncbi:hypothetical protein D3C77_659220 [compost metagenome]